MTDSSLTENTIQILDEGYVRVLDDFPVVNDSTILTPGERKVVAAARMSTNRGIKDDVTDLKLLEYLYENKHTSPFEMVNLTFELRLPLFVCVHFLRHRTGKFNQFSGRYAPFPKDSFYNPLLNPEREFTQEQEELVNQMNENLYQTYSIYEAMLKKGIPKEVARYGLPNSQYTLLMVQMDLNNLLKMLWLRCDSHSQLETRQYAEGMMKLAKRFFPNVVRMWEEEKNSITLSQKEVECIKDQSYQFETNSVSKGKAWEKKKEALGF